MNFAKKIYIKTIIIFDFLKIPIWIYRRALRSILYLIGIFFNTLDVVSQCVLVAWCVHIIKSNYLFRLPTDSYWAFVAVLCGKRPGYWFIKNQRNTYDWAGCNETSQFHLGGFCKLFVTLNSLIFTELAIML